MIPLTVEDAILADFRAGDPRCMIARRHGVSISTVGRVAVRHGATPAKQDDDEPTFKKVPSYFCDGEGGEWHNQMLICVSPCRICYVEKWMRSRK